jgi:hypothetical protein
MKRDGKLSPDGLTIIAGDRLYRGASDTGRVVPGMASRLASGGWPLQWSADSKSVFFLEPDYFNVGRMDVATGHSEHVLDLTPARGSNIIELVGVSFADDPRRYAYAAAEYHSTLFLVHGRK